MSLNQTNKGITLQIWAFYFKVLPMLINSQEEVIFMKNFLLTTFKHKHESQHQGVYWKQDLVVLIVQWSSSVFQNPSWGKHTTHMLIWCLQKIIWCLVRLTRWMSFKTYYSHEWNSRNPLIPLMPPWQRSWTVRFAKRWLLKIRADSGWYVNWWITMGTILPARNSSWWSVNVILLAHRRYLRRSLGSRCPTWTANHNLSLLYRPTLDWDWLRSLAQSLWSLFRNLLTKHKSVLMKFKMFVCIPMKRL